MLAWKVVQKIDERLVAEQFVLVQIVACQKRALPKGRPAAVRKVNLRDAHPGCLSIAGLRLEMAARTFCSATHMVRQRTDLQPGHT